MHAWFLSFLQLLRGFHSRALHRPGQQYPGTGGSASRATHENLNAEFTDDLSDVNLPQLREECGRTHVLGPDARHLDYFLLFLPTFYFQMVATKANRNTYRQNIRTGYVNSLSTECRPDFNIRRKGTIRPA